MSFVFAGVNMDEDLPIDIHCNKLLGMVWHGAEDVGIV